MIDKIAAEFFKIENWEAALEKGVAKGIDKKDLRALTNPEIRAALYQKVKSGNYEIAPPHMAEIPKDDGTTRTVYVNENVDRIFLSIANDVLFKLCPDMIHESCKSYQKGIGCGKVVQRVSKTIAEANGKTIGWKSDLTKYFDSVPIEYIDKAFDEVEKRCGKSMVIDVLRKYYNTDLCFDIDGNLVEHYQSLKQGCSVASFLADSVLYHLDEKMSKLKGYYVRYSDDCLFVGPDYEKAMNIMQTELGLMQMSLNPKKVEYLSGKNWFKFLGFSIRGAEISISKNRLKTFQKEIMARTIKDRNISVARSINQVNRYLYKGNGEHSWATQMLCIINVDRDIQLMNDYVMDALRAVATKKRRIGGLGYIKDGKDGVVDRGRGKNVKSNRIKTEKEIEGYMSLNCMRNVLLTDRSAYRTLVMQM